MLIEYVEDALKRASYSIIEDDEPYCGEIEDLPGVWAAGKTLEECRENLKETLESWILVSIKKNMPIPKLGKYQVCKERRKTNNQGLRIYPFINSKTHLRKMMIKSQDLVQVVGFHDHKAGTISKRKTFIFMVLEKFPAFTLHRFID